MKPKIVIIVFCLTVLFFLLPWIDVSCMGAKVVSISGIQMVTGSEYSEQSLTGGQSQATRMDSEPIVIAAFVIALFGIIASVIKWRKAFVARIFFGIIGAILLIALRFRLESRIPQDSQGMVQFNYLIGYWLTLLSFIAAAVMSFFSRRPESDLDKITKPQESKVGIEDERPPPDNLISSSDSVDPIMPLSNTVPPLRFSNPKEVTLTNSKLESTFIRKEQIQRYLANLEKLKGDGAITEQSYVMTKIEYDEKLKAVEKEIVDTKVLVNNELELRRNDLMAYRTELENLKTRFQVGELPIETYRARDRDIRRRLRGIQAGISQLEVLVAAKSSAEISPGILNEKQPQAGSSLLTTQPKRGRMLKIVGTLVCAVGTIAAVLFVPCRISGTNYGWHFILESVGTTTKAYNFINTIILVLELVAVNAIGLALVLLGFRQKPR